MTDPNYKSPELVAREVEKRYRDNCCQQEFDDSLLDDDEPQYDDDYEQD